MDVSLDSGFKKFLSRTYGDWADRSVSAVLSMSREGATVPFMARYRKEKTGNLDEVAIRAILDGQSKYSELVKRREFILQEIEKQGNLSSELKLRIVNADSLPDLEEIYRPYKRKKKTKATLAKEAGLDPLADWVWKLGHGELVDATSLEVKAKEFIKTDKGFVTYQEVLRGAQHIIIERLSNDLSLRELVRREYFERAQIHTQKSKEFKKNSKYDMYAEYKEAVKNLRSPKSSHRYLAIRRGWQEEELKVDLVVDQEKLLKEYQSFALSHPKSQAAELLKECAEHALKIHVTPSIANELHGELKELADQHAIEVFAQNLRKVLMMSPFGPKVVLGVDPGLKTGCKLALVDKSGQYISGTVLKMHTEEDFTQAQKLLGDVLRQIKIECLAVGNGTGGREAETFLRKVLKSIASEVSVVMVNESGASVYSASDLAREEFPDLDVTVRGAISIARRLQDPLAELVKIDPKSIGVGQYQHDVNQGELKKSLEGVVESCVNQVGVDLNTGSESLLQFVSGIGPALAKKIVNHRQKVGLFKERGDLMRVESFSSKTFEQAAGFLRIHDGPMILDRTGIHPERYSAVKEMAKELGLTMKSLVEGGHQKLKDQAEKWAELVGQYTFEDILVELQKPGRDPRSPFKLFSYRDDIHEIKDLKKGIICPGLVTNVTNFGAFVDIGVHQDGLVHISELSNSFVNDPRMVVNPGDQVTVRVLDFDIEKSQISLSMKLEERPSRPVNREAERGTPRRGRERPPRGGRSPGKRPEKRKETFNNPFAVLGQLKGNRE